MTWGRYQLPRYVIFQGFRQVQLEDGERLKVSNLCIFSWRFRRCFFQTNLRMKGWNTVSIGWTFFTIQFFCWGFFVFGFFFQAPNKVKILNEIEVIHGQFWSKASGGWKITRGYGACSPWPRLRLCSSIEVLFLQIWGWCLYWRAVLGVCKWVSTLRMEI